MVAAAVLSVAVVELRADIAFDKSLAVFVNDAETWSMGGEVCVCVCVCVCV